MPGLFFISFCLAAPDFIVFHFGGHRFSAVMTLFWICYPQAHWHRCHGHVLILRTSFRVTIFYPFSEKAVPIKSLFPIIYC